MGPGVEILSDYTWNTESGDRYTWGNHPRIIDQDIELSVRFRDMLDNFRDTFVTVDVEWELLDIAPFGKVCDGFNTPRSCVDFTPLSRELFASIMLGFVSRG